MIFVFIFFIILFSCATWFLFQKIFVRGEVYDITSLKIGRNRRLKSFQKELEENLSYMHSLPSEWHYVTSEDGLRLAGKLFLCPNANKMVILFHGYRSIAENDFSTYFKWYYEQGYHILLVDQRAHGRSEGKYITFGVKERYDCIKWCEYVEKHFPKMDEMILAGMSMGATTVLLASGLELPSKVKAIIADSSFSSPKEIIATVASRDYGMDAMILFPLLNLFCKVKAHFTINDCSVTEALKNNHLPVLFIHALGDNFVPSKMTKENYEACHTQKALVLVDCSAHGFSCVYEKEKVLSSLKKFLSEI